MRRRRFLQGAAGAVAAAPALGAPALAAPALAQGPAVTSTVTWRMATGWPKSLDLLHGSALAMAQRLAELTEGRFRLQIFAAGEIVPALGVFDAAARGTIDCCHTLSTRFVDRDPAIGFDGGMPFGLNARQQQAWMTGGGRELTREVFARFGLVNVPCGNLGVRMGGWFRREIVTPDDLKGLRLRIGGLGGAVLARLGALPQPIAAGDIHTGLEGGTLDGAEWIGPHDDERLGFARVAPFYYTPGFWEGSAQVTALVNADRWAGLPPAFRAAFEVAAAEQCLRMTASYDVRNPQALRRLVAAGARLRAFPPPVLEACRKAAVETLDEFAAQSAGFRKVYESWKAFADETNLWFRVAENTLDQFRFAAPRWSGG